MDETQGRFVNLMKQEANLLQELNDLLLEETEALKSKNTGLITGLVTSKNTMLDKLGMLDQQRQLYMETEKPGSPYDEGFESHIREMNSSIQKLLDQCKHQNKINGSIIEISQMFNNKILDIVLGHSSEDDTYSAEGKNPGKNHQKTIARV